jgi:hypothetical protein
MTIPAASVKSIKVVWGFEKVQIAQPSSIQQKVLAIHTAAALLRYAAVLFCGRNQKPKQIL